MKDFVFGGGSVIPMGSRKTSKADKYSKFTPRCYESHPAMPLPGRDKVIYGGSCSMPIVTDADIYIGFDGSMRMQGGLYPWNNQHEILHLITDQKAPANAKAFTALAAWTLMRIDEGRKVHCGCIGGHGRTGTFLAALVSLCGEKDAITYVREHYCDKAVETSDQVDFLVKTYGIKSAKSRAPFKTYKMGFDDLSAGSIAHNDAPLSTGGRVRDFVATHVKAKTIWGQNPVG